jgi:flavin reductase (DIM6/NTAB) family NADH-FMN oxidoreductase RutF
LSDAITADAIAAFKLAMRRFASGITIVTTMLDNEPKGLTATAFSSVSVDPPTVLVVVNRSTRSHPIIAQAQRFCVNVLALEQRELAQRFASRAERPFDGIPWHVGASGSPVFDDALASFDCDVLEEFAAATHAIFLGTVRECRSRAGSPLGYFDGEYRDFGLHAP